jgi:hypothetical protein
LFCGECAFDRTPRVDTFKAVDDSGTQKVLQIDDKVLIRSTVKFLINPYEVQYVLF